MSLQDPVHRGMRPLPHDFPRRTGLLRRRLQPPILPQPSQQLAQPDLHPRRRPFPPEMSDRLTRLDDLAPGDHLLLHVLEQLLAGDLIPLSSYARGDLPAHHLDEVIQQQAHRELEDHPFRSGADQVLQPEDFGDLLEHTFNPPAIQVHLEQVHRRHRPGVAEVRHQAHILLAGPIQGDPPNVHPLLVPRAAQVPPLLDVPPAAAVMRLAGRARRVGVERHPGMIADQEGVPMLGEAGGLGQVAEGAIADPEPLLGDESSHFGHQVAHEADLVGIAVGMGAHGHGQAAAHVQGDQGPSAQQAAGERPTTA